MDDDAHAEKMVDLATEITVKIVDNRPIRDSIELVSLVTSMVFRTLLTPARMEQIIDYHLRVIRSSPEKSLIKGSIIPIVATKQHH